MKGEDNMAFARPRGKKKIVSIYMKLPHTGRMTSKSTKLLDIPENKEKIEQMLQVATQQEKEIKMNMKGLGCRNSVESLLELHLASKAQCKEGTRRNYRKTYDKLAEKIDLTKPCVDEINVKKMTDWINEIYSEPKYSYNTKALHVRNIFNIVGFANKHKLIQNVELDDALRPKKSKVKGRPLTIEMVQKLIFYAAEKGDVHVLAFIILMLHQGNRPIEISGLTELRIDLVNKTMLISFTKVDKEYTIPIHPLCIDMLSYLIKRQKPGEPLFRITKGATLDIINKYFEELGFRKEGFRAYNLRHTFINAAKKAEVRSDSIAKLLGHTVQSTASQHYYDESLADTASELAKISYPIPNYFELINDIQMAKEVDKIFREIKEKEFMKKYPDIWRKLERSKKENLKPLIRNLNLVNHALENGHLDKFSLENIFHEYYKINKDII